MPDVDLRQIPGEASLADAHAVRRTVFIEEQGVSEAIEMDGRDGAAHHLVAYADDQPVGTARLREPRPGVGKVERVAVLADRRDRGIGRALMDALEDLAASRGAHELVLHAQTSVETFYRDLGYETVGDVFEEAGIPHVEMRKDLSGDPGSQRD